MLSAQTPTHRPVWMIVLAATMLLYGGMTLVRGLLVAQDPRAVARQTISNQPRTPEADEVVRKLQPTLNGIVDRHRVGVRLDAIASIAYGLFTLYAVAAVLSRDRSGRRLALLTALFGIAYQLGELPLEVRIARDMVAAAGPLLGEIMATGAADGGHSPAELMATLDVATALFAAVGVGWCLLLLRYFGGRRGRELYGLVRNPERG